MSKEDSIQEAIRLVQECNYSRRKAASSTGVSPNTLKRRLNGSIPREKYLERTKKITASEELVLENMIIALIQQNEHVKASTLRLLVALYVRNKSAPLKISPEETLEDEDLELIPKGWCTRFIKRSHNLVVNQGQIEIKDENKVPALPEPLPAFAMLLKPSSNANETVAETQKHIVDSASTTIQGLRMAFDATAKKALSAANSPEQVKQYIEELSAHFQEVSTLASVLNVTSHISPAAMHSDNSSGRKSRTKSTSGRAVKVNRQYTPEYLSPESPVSPARFASNASSAAAAGAAAAAAATDAASTTSAPKRTASVLESSSTDDDDNNYQYASSKRAKPESLWTEPASVANLIPSPASTDVSWPMTSTTSNTMPVVTPTTFESLFMTPATSGISPQVTLFTSADMKPITSGAPVMTPKPLFEEDYAFPTFSSADYFSALTSTTGAPMVPSTTGPYDTNMPITNGLTDLVDMPIIADPMMTL